MKKGTVKRRIFISNALMVLACLLIFLGINLLIIKIYEESLEKEFKASAELVINEAEIKELLDTWVFHRNEFLVLFVIDGLLCIAGLLIISQIFTKNLTDHIMEPLEELSQGARRIKENNLTQGIAYCGDLEFENVCEAFNDMQKHILTEQEKNHKYEKARTDMIAGISHDLRTPLTAVRGTIKALMDGVVSAPEKQVKFLQTAYRRTGDMDRLLNQLFYLSKMETGNMPIHMQNIEISSFLEKYVKGKQEVLELEGEEIYLNTNQIQANVQADPEQLQRILDNLLENSRRYGENKPLKINIQLNRIPSGLQICFKDNGVGVSEDKLPFIFEEFYRGDESRNKQEGNGLGLYIVKYLIQAMGGKVTAENKNGLMIYMELPIGKEGES